MDARDWRVAVAPVLYAADQLAGAAHVSRGWATLLGWGIEAGLLTAAEAEAAHGRSGAEPVQLLEQRFLAALQQRLEHGLGAGLGIERERPQWSLLLAEDRITGEHYRVFEADRIAWLAPPAQRAWKRLQRDLLATTPFDLWDQHHGNLSPILADYNPRRPKAAWEAYLADDCTEADEDGDGNPADTLFGHREIFEGVMTALASKPRACRHGPRWDAGGARSRAVAAFLRRAQRFLARLPGKGNLYSLADGMSHPGDAAVILAAPGQATAAGEWFSRYYDGGGEWPGNELGIALGTGELPLQRAVYTVATTAILVRLDQLLDPKVPPCP